MKKLLLLNACFLALGLSAPLSSDAQSKLEIMGSRLLVDAPSPINHVVRFTYSAATAGAAWGADITPIQHQEVVKAVDSEACTTLTGTYAGKWVLIYRGNCEFGQKAKKAQDAGAIGVIIWNHTPNAPLVNMSGGTAGAQVTIPVLFVSNEDGREMTSFLSGPNTMYISLTKWGFNENNDLAIVAHSPAMTHAGAIPLYQFEGSPDVPAYRAYNGAFVANLGIVNQTNVELRSEGTFTPTGGSATVLYNDTVAIDTFKVADSILQFFNAHEYKLSPTSTGRYDFTYSLSSDSVDVTPSDNTEKLSMQITNNVFCKGGFDVASQTPVINSHTAAATGLSTWGPLYYVKKGGHTLETTIFSVEARDTSVKSLSNALQKYIEIFCFKWTDGTGGPQDNYMQAGELNLVSIAAKEFAPADSSNGKMKFAAYWGDNELGKNKTITLEDDSWYWIAADISDVFFLGVDGNTNFYNRANAAQNFATNKREEFWAPRYTLNSARQLKNSPSDTVFTIPFGISGALASGNIDSASFTGALGVPNIAIYTTPFPTGVTPAKVNNDIIVYPNPASNKVNLSYKLDHKAELVHFKVVDAFGRTVYSEDKTDVVAGEVSVNTSNFVSGNYYFIMIEGEKTLFRPFTVISK